ncbi:hypothetical protein [Peribacillus asahii]|uniref:Uncharacterized protein n=1 Tax=Peribacillus asahii TaxID=228899 RepID=A0A3Q9RM79_9BACI|nr:hypothetical protein [Peribacillus asahii]AZV44927.1 hypothetical protein BAOM_4347 [Peribacillus asahii]USK84555.1 hypothetical protein LIT35_19515 [Peribacillus asahii]
MDLLYKLLLYIHVLSVIVSIGPFFILLPISKKMHLVGKEELDAYLGTFRFVVRLAMHSGHVLVISGILLVMSGPWTWNTSWIIMTLLILFCSLFFLARAFSPKLRKFQEKDTNKEELAVKLQRTIWIYILLLITMLWFMVVKPALWA